MAKPRPGSSKGFFFFTLFFYELYIYKINLFAVQNLNLSPIEGGKKLSKSGGDYTASEQYKKDNQTLLLQVSSTFQYVSEPFKK